MSKTERSEPQQPAVGAQVVRGVGRLELERVGPALQEVVRKLWEAPPGTPIPVPREAIAAADAPLRGALARELAAIRRRERGPLPGADWAADMRARLERPCCGTLHGSRHRATCPNSKTPNAKQSRATRPEQE